MMRERTADDHGGYEKHINLSYRASSDDWINGMLFLAHHGNSFISVSHCRLRSFICMVLLGSHRSDIGGSRYGAVADTMDRQHKKNNWLKHWLLFIDF